MVMTIGAWNIRGLNNSQKQKKVQQWINKNNVSIMGFIEPRILPVNMATVECGLGIQSWQFQSNVHLCSLCRILVGWDATKVTVIVVHMVVQWITCDVIDIGGNGLTRISFVYGLNTPVERQPLWNYLAQQGTFNSTNPWVVMGDCNAILSSMDRQGGDHQWHNYMDDFLNCVSSADLINLPIKEVHFTWHNGEGNIRSQSYCDSHDASSSSAKEEIQIPKFVDSSGGLSGCSAGNLDGGSLWVRLAKEEWEAAQVFLDHNPTNREANDREREACGSYHRLCADEESFYKQRSRVQWLQLGDKNTVFFHRSLLQRRTRNMIMSLKRESGIKMGWGVWRLSILVSC
ncbi:hypothetical protein OIU78_027976 [Salix suchowensis]|nr:hypothetical protein OIU78_027976 [Salix suchowensis]